MQKHIRTETFRMDMTLVGANKNARIKTEGKNRYYSNFYDHNLLTVHSYSKIIYHEIYPGIDWVIYTKNNQIKYDFLVGPGADPSLIKMEFNHHKSLKLNEDGSFTVENKLGSITEKAPVSFQEGKPIQTKFILDRNTISFRLGNYSKNSALVIDPTLLWAAYYGGLSTDYAWYCSTDASGNVYLAGETNSSSSIASGGHQNTYGNFSDAFLVKFNSSGVRQWATYYGGAGSEAAYCCSNDATGNVYLTGYTTSTASIASGGHQNLHTGNNEAFLVKFNSSGVRQWGTYYGGTSSDVGYCTSTDPSGNTYLAGYTQSTLGIASGGHQNVSGGGTAEAFLVKFNSSGVRQWGTYYGGAASEFGWACANDGLNNIYLVGQCTSTTNIASGGHQNSLGGSDDAFLAKFNSSGVRQWATYYGGTGDDLGRHVITDASNNVYISGRTESTASIASV